MEWIIYKHTSPSGKVYIGQTMQTNPKIRWQNGNGYKSHNTIFYAAIKKHGWNNFTHEIIESHILTQEKANEREIFWISFYDSFKNGYNSTAGGNYLGDNVASKPVAQILLDFPKKIYKKYKSAQEAGRKTGICSRNIGACCLKQGQITAGGYYWCFLDDFETFKVLEKRQGKVNLRKVYCFETDAIYSSIIEASRKLNISKDGILACCKHKQITAGDCHFSYLEEKDFYIPNRRKKHIKHNYLYQIDIKSLSIIHEFVNISDASRATNVSRQQIGKCLNNIYKSAGGYYWCKKNFWYPGWQPELKRHPNSKEVYCIETNEKFETLNDASKVAGINISSISECCNKKMNTAGGLHWCFYSDFLNGDYKLNENKNNKKIVCIETKEIFEKIEYACSKYNLHSSNISYCLKHPSRTCGGFHWCYFENYVENYEIPKKRITTLRSVKNSDTGEIFASIREAADKYNICESNIQRVCKGRAKTAGGFHWHYLNDK